MGPKPDFSALVHGALTTTRVPTLLRSSAAFVFERIARGGGATNWYYCEQVADLPLLEARLSPGSVVSFYFDERIRRAPSPLQAKAEIETIIRRTGDSVVAIRGSDPIALDAEVLVSLGDLAEFMSKLPASTELFFGATPGRDDDGQRSVTLTLPDDDGVVRAHPH